MDNIIKLTNINKSFKKQKVLSNVNIEFERGKIHGIIGRNGSGKTVLIKIICGFILPDTGEVIVDGVKIGKEIDFPKNVGITIETPGFLPYKSGYKNLEYLASIKNEIDSKVIAQSMEIVGLDPLNKKHVSKYSLGMKQRLSLAQAIMENPNILILDEPMNGLDKSGVEDMCNLFKQFKDEGKTIIIISHHSEDIDTLCDTIHEINSGEITKIL